MLTEELMDQVWDKFPDLKESQEVKDKMVGTISHSSGFVLVGAMLSLSNQLLCPHFSEVV